MDDYYLLSSHIPDLSHIPPCEPRDLWGQTLRPLPTPGPFHFILSAGEGPGIAQFESWPPGTSLFSYWVSYPLNSGISTVVEGFGAELFRLLPQFSAGLFLDSGFWTYLHILTIEGRWPFLILSTWSFFITFPCPFPWLQSHFLSN